MVKNGGGYAFGGAVLRRVYAGQSARKRTRSFPAMSREAGWRMLPLTDLTVFTAF